MQQLSIICICFNNPQSFPFEIMLNVIKIFKLILLEIIFYQMCSDILTSIVRTILFTMKKLRPWIEECFSYKTLIRFCVIFFHSDIIFRYIILKIFIIFQYVSSKHNNPSKNASSVLQVMHHCKDEDKNFSVKKCSFDNECFYTFMASWI